MCFIDALYQHRVCIIRLERNVDSNFIMRATYSAVGPKVDIPLK